MSVKKHLTKLKKGKALLEQGQQTTQIAKQAKGLLTGAGGNTAAGVGSMISGGGFAGGAGQKAG
ncbi:hypothetical protein [Xenorhabdus siamensis]|uniref:hypothetical protein n=1 Tax=Xenorhabdus siamensis TaxID=3136254 RepID=UPI0030F481AE